MDGNGFSNSPSALRKISRDNSSLVSSGFPNGGIVNVDAWVIGTDRKSSLSSVSWNKRGGMPPMNGDGLPAQSVHDSCGHLGPFIQKAGDASVFSSSLPVLHHEKLNLASSVGQSVDTGASHLDREAAEEALALDEEMVSQALGDFLPDDEDELLAGITEGFDFMSLINTAEENEELNLFSSGGGMEMDGDAQECFGMYVNNPRCMDGFFGNAAALHGPSNGPGSVIGEHPYGEHPSRTLFVRNINSNVEDSELRALFEQYGAIRTLYTACKHRGFVMISYYDIRAARSAMRALQNKPLRRRKLDIHFSIPKDNPSDKDVNQGTLVVFNLDASVSNDDLRQIFGQYGEVKEIRETPHKRHHKFIEFYDVRAAEAALRALNRSDIAGKRIKLEPSRPGGARRSLMQQLTQELEQEETRSYRQQSSSPVTNSPPGHPSSWGHFGSPIENGPSRSFHHPVATVVPGMNKTVPGLPVPLPLSNSMRVGTIGSHLGRNSQIDASLSPAPGGFTVKAIPHHHAHSLPEYGNGIMPFYNPPAPVSIRGAAPAHGTHDGFEGLRLPRTTSAGNDVSLFEHVPGAHAIPSTGSLSLINPGSGRSASMSGPQFLWGGSSSYQQNSSPVVWSTPAMGHSFNPAGHVQPQPFAYSGSHGRFVNTVFPSHRHHVGSAPSGDPSNLERQLGYVKEAPDTSYFGPGTLGAVGIPGSTRAAMMDMNGTHNIVKSGSLGTNGCFESGIPPSLGMMSSLRRSQMFQTNGIAMTSTSDGLVDRGRIRRTDSSTAQMDNKKQYQLDIDRILRGEDTRTTLMIKNIPNKYTSKMLLAAIDENHRGTYDFLYLPIDFKNKCNVGYAFINMTSPAHIIPIYQAFNGKKWEKFNSEKVASLAYARIQGKAALVAHFQNSSLMNEDKRCRPILFHSDGPEIGEQEQSPLGVQARVTRDQSGIGDFLELNHNISNRDGFIPGSVGSSSGGMVSSSPEKE